MIGFTTPWILAALALLPAIWWLLRVIPPAPQQVRFPAIRLLRDLVAREETPARTPLWLVLLRMLLAAMLILALAGPVLRPSVAPPGRDPEILVIDNGWAAAELWTNMQRALLDEIDRAERAGRSVVLLPTARPASGDPVAPIGPLPAGQARRAAETLSPVPWRPERSAAAAVLNRFDGRSTALWLADGITDPAAPILARAIAGFTEPRVRLPRLGELPKLLLPPAQGPDLALTVKRPKAGLPEPVTLAAHGADGRLLGEAKGDFAATATAATLRFELPTEIRNEVARIDIAGSHGAGSTVLLDERWKRRLVGIVSTPGGDEPDALLSGTFYLKKALEPFAEVKTGELADLLPAAPSVLILTDAVPLSPGDKRVIAEWVATGGLLLRFAGPKLAAADPAAADPLLPTPLRTGGRSLSGALAWTEPAPLGPFPESSPLAGLDIPSDVTVSRQVLAEPGVDLDRKVWARLADGTPLVTADRHEKGTIVLVHTTAGPSWTNLPLSGLLPQMLRRITAYSAGLGRPSATGTLDPQRLLDGFARLQIPSGIATAIAADKIEITIPEPQHPPGFYGDVGARRALNLSQTLTAIEPLEPPAGLTVLQYESSGEVALGPDLLAATLGLAALDTLLALWLGGALPGRRRLRPVALAVLLALSLAGPASAAEPAVTDAEHAASQVTLGYIVTGDPTADRISQAGLDGLAQVLMQRTSINHAAAAQVDVDRDELSVFPLLYWPIAANAHGLSDQAKGKLNRYLATGGMILIDTRAGASGQAPNLGALIDGLDVPVMVPIPPTHVLTKSFYLLNEFPGRLSGSALWVERDQDVHNDGVSSVVVGGADWAAAWAVDGSGAPMFNVTPGGERQREMAYRFGVNLVMYALTGNYKSDLVHSPYIQERLGQ